MCDVLDDGLRTSAITVLRKWVYEKQALRSRVEATALAPLEALRQVLLDAGSDAVTETIFPQRLDLYFMVASMNPHLLHQYVNVFLVFSFIDGMRM